MNSSRLNWRFLTLFVVVSGAAFGVYFAVHARQVSRQSELLPAIAERYLADGKAPRALRTLNRYLIKHPEDIEARLRYARILLESKADATGKIQALDSLRTVLEKDPSRDDIRKEIIQILMEVEKFDSAQAVLQELAARGVKDAWTTETLGKVFAYQKKWDKVNELLTPVCMDAKSAMPSDYARLAEARRELAKNNKSSIAEADEVVEKLVNDHPNEVEAFLIRAGYRQLYNLAGIEADLDEAKRLAPASPAVAIFRAARVLKEDPKTALAELAEALKSAPDDVNLLELAANAESLAGHPQETLKLLRKASSVRPLDGHLALSVAHALVDVGDWNAAKVQLESAKGLIGADPIEVDLLTARLQLEAGEWAAAKTALESVKNKFVKAKRPVQPIIALLARCALMAGDIDSQINLAREASTSANPAGQLIYASALAEAGRLEEAEDVYRLLLRDPKAPPSAAFGLAQILVIKLGSSGKSGREGDWLEVDRLLKRAGTAVPEAWEIPVLKAEALLTRGKTNEAIGVLKEALDKAPKEKALWAAIAAATARDGKAEDAEALLAKGKKQAGDSADLRLTALRIRFGGKSDKNLVITEAGEGIDAFPDVDKIRVWSAQAEGYELTNNLKMSASVLDKLLMLRPNDLRTLLSRFDLAARMKDEEVASRILSEITRLEGPKGVIAEYVAAYRIVRDVQAKAIDKSKLNEARRHLVTVAARKPNWAKAILLRAEIEELDGHADRAAIEFREAFMQGERSFALLRRLVDYYTERRDFKEADALIQSIREKGKLNPAQSRAFAEIYFQAPDYVRALQLAKQSVDEDSKNPDDFLWLARVGFAAGEPVAVVEGALRRATELAGDSPGAWAALISYLKATKREPEAQQVIAKLNNPPAAKMVSVILAPCYEALGDLDKAEVEYLKALGEKPNDLRLAQGASAFFIRTARWGRAETVLRGIADGKFSASPADVSTARRDLAITLTAMGRSNEALPLLDRNEATDKIRSPADSRARAIILSQNRMSQRAAFDLLDYEFGRRALSPSELFLYVRLAVFTEQFRTAKQAMIALLGVESEKSADYLVFWIDVLLKRDELADAEFYFRVLAKLRTDSLDFARLQAVLSFKGGRAVEASNRLKVYTTKTIAEEALLSASFEEVGDYAEAEKHIRAYASKMKSPMADLAVARYLGRRSLYAAAIDIAESVNKSKAVPTDLIATVAQDLLRSGEKPADANQVRRVEKWLADAPVPAGREWQPPWLLGELADIRGDSAAAIAGYRKALSLAPNQPFVVPSLARLLCLSGSQADALEAGRLAGEALKATPVNADELAEIEGLALLKQGRTAKAIERLNAVAATSPTPRGGLYLTAALLESGLKEEAIKMRQITLSRGFKEYELHPLERDLWKKLSVELMPKN